MAQDRTGELGEESLDEIEPRAVLGGEGELEASSRSSGEPGSGFSRYVRGMVVEDQLDRSVRRIGGIDEPEELDELSTAVAIFDKGMDLAGEQINPSQQAERAMAFVFMVARKGGVNARLGRVNPAPSLRWPGFPASRRRR